MILSMIVFYVTIILIITVSEAFIFGMVSIPVYLFIAYISDETTQYLFNQQISDEIYGDLTRAKSSRPKLSMTISKYMVAQKSIQGQSQVYGNQKVHKIEFKNWHDNSNNIAQVSSNLQKNQISLLKIDKKMSYSTKF